MTAQEDQVESRDDRDPPTDRFAWRARLRARPAMNTTYRIGVAVVGLAIIAVGVIALPLPGPGWAIIFTGLGLWSTEFVWAKRLLRWTKRMVLGWARWLQRQARWMQGLVSLLIFLLVVDIFWGMLLISGVPSFLPEWAKDLLSYVPGLG